MFEYFPENYVWSMAAHMAVNLGANLSDVDDACRPLRHVAGGTNASAIEAWVQNWMKVAERAERLARADEAAGRRLSAGNKYRKACIYYFTAERMLAPADPRKLDVHRRMRAAFRRFVDYRGERIEFVEVPFGDALLPALYVPPSHPSGDGASPCMIHFDGLDVMKEFIYLGGMPVEAGRRGIALLIVDHPGVGEALRERGLTLTHEVEKPAGACVDWLEARDEVDSDRIGIMALSLGGYYAPRAAAFEKRLKCCVAWGAIWDFGENAERRRRLGGTQNSVNHWEAHNKWVFGKASFDEALEEMHRISLKGVIDKVTCPLLIVHGENDRQVPLHYAEASFEGAFNAASRELKVFPLADGGSEHCQVDHGALAVEYMTDWIAETFGTRTA